jgi:acyl carrier protein
MSVRSDLQRLVRANSKLALAHVEESAILGHELGFDSQALLALLLDVEDAFGIEIPPERVPDLVGISFGRFADLVEQAGREAARP